MKKILLAIIALAPIFVFAKGEIKLYCDSIGGENHYKDSVIMVRMIPMGYDKLHLFIMNLSDERVTIEWENARIDGSHIASPDDLVFEMNKARQDEVVIPGASSSKLVCKRYSTLVPIFDKKKMKKEGHDSVTIILPYRKGDDIIDLKFRIYARIE